MTFWNALGIAAVTVGMAGSGIALLYWTLVVWPDEEWWMKALNVAAWILVIGFVIWRVEGAA